MRSWNLSGGVVYFAITFQISQPSMESIQAVVGARTCFVYNMEVYAGSQPDVYMWDKPIDIVQRLVAPISGSHRNITSDTSYELVSMLGQTYGLTSVGTLRKNKR